MIKSNIYDVFANALIVTPNMTNTYFHVVNKELEKVGQQWQTITAKMTSQYPPFNIKKIKPTKFVIEIAVAGFDKSDIDMEVEENVLTVRGTMKNTPRIDGEEETFLHKGISSRDWIRTFQLSDTMEVKGANMENGLLVITVENNIPEKQKPKKIEIGIVDKKQFLTE